MSAFENEDIGPGKKNKLRVGNKVKAKPELIDWHVKHLSWCFGSTHELDNAYSKGEKEIKEENFGQVYLILKAKLSGEMPFGTVTHFGSMDTCDDTGKLIEGRKCVWVKFKTKTKFGTFNYQAYFSESQLVKVK